MKREKGSGFFERKTGTLSRKGQTDRNAIAAHVNGDPGEMEECVGEEMEEEEEQEGPTDLEEESEMAEVRLSPLPPPASIPTREAAGDGQASVVDAGVSGPHAESAQGPKPEVESRMGRVAEMAKALDAKRVGV